MQTAVVAGFRLARGFQVLLAAYPPATQYLDYAALERGLVATGADAVWVGWGFVAEHPEFVAMCERLGLNFIGLHTYPRWSTIEERGVGMSQYEGGE